MEYIQDKVQQKKMAIFKYWIPEQMEYPTKTIF